eukprot:5172301-Ditylum_brightwellii.AAC.1
MCGPSNQQNVSACQPDTGSGTWHTIHNLQLFTWGRGRASYTLWSLARLPKGNLVVWGARGASGMSVQRLVVPMKKGVIQGAKMLTSCLSHSRGRISRY